MKYDTSFAGCEKSDGTDWTACVNCELAGQVVACKMHLVDKSRKYTTRQYILVGKNGQPFNPNSNSVSITLLTEARKNERKRQRKR